MRYYVLIWFTWCIVLCRSDLWSFISSMCSGAGLVVSVVGRVSGMRVDGPLLVEALRIVALIRLAYEFVVCGGRLSGVINCFHEACMVVSSDVMSWGSFLSFVDAGRSRVALRVSREVRRDVLGPGLSPFGNLATVTFVGWLCRE